MKKIKPFLFTVLLGLTVNVSAQHYLNCPQLANPSYMGKIDNFSFYLSGEYAFVGFEGAPKSLGFNATIPVADKRKSSSWRNPDNKSMHIGLSLTGSHLGARTNYSTLANYGYKLRLTANAHLSFGLGVGVDYKGLNISKLDNSSNPDPGLSDTYYPTKWNFQAGFGTTFMYKGLYTSVFTPAIMGDSKSVYLQIGWKTQKKDRDYYHEREKKSTNSFEIHSLSGYNITQKAYEQQVSALFYIANTLGIGINWEYPKSLSGLIAINVGFLKIGYSYKIMGLNPKTNTHSITLNVSISKKES